MKLHKITRVEIPRHPVLLLTFDDGFAGEVDFAEIIADGGVMDTLRDPKAFGHAEITDGGRSLGWLIAQSETIEFCADALRLKAEEQVVRARAARFAARSTAAAE